MRIHILLPTSLLLVAIAVAAWCAVYHGPVEAPRQVGTVLLYSKQDSARFTDPCSGQAACFRVAIEDFDCSGLETTTLIISGHSLPPTYLHTSAEHLAEVVECLGAELVVLDTCYGFSSPVLQALVSVNRSLLVIGAITRLPPEGLKYDPGFFEPAAPDVRGSFVQLRGSGQLQRWRVASPTLREAMAGVARWPPAQLSAHLQRKHPNLVRVPLMEGEQPSAIMLVPVAPRRFRP